MISSFSYDEGDFLPIPLSSSDLENALENDEEVKRLFKQVKTLKNQLIQAREKQQKLQMKKDKVEEQVRFLTNQALEKECQHGVKLFEQKRENEMLKKDLQKLHNDICDRDTLIKGMKDASMENMGKMWHIKNQLQEKDTLINDLRIKIKDYEENVQKKRKRVRKRKRKRKHDDNIIPRSTSTKKLATPIEEENRVDIVTPRPGPNTYILLCKLFGYHNHSKEKVSKVLFAKYDSKYGQMMVCDWINASVVTSCLAINADVEKQLHMSDDQFEWINTEFVHFVRNNTKGLSRLKVYKDLKPYTNSKKQPVGKKAYSFWWPAADLMNVRKIKFHNA